MRQLRFLAFAVISFVAALLGALLSPSTWLHKALAVALCGVLSANPALCTNNAIAVHSHEASATNPVKVETTQFSDLLAQRSRDFDTDAPKSPPRNNPNNSRPSSFPNEVSPNTPVRRPDFDDFNSTSNTNQSISTKNTNEIRVKNVVIRELREKVIEMSVPSPNGCKVTRVLNGSTRSPYIESIKIEPIDKVNCAIQPTSFYFNPTKKIIEARTYLEETLKVEFLGESIAKVEYTNPSGYKRSVQLSYVDKNKSVIQQSSSEKSYLIEQMYIANSIVGGIVCDLCKMGKFLQDILMGQNPFEGDLGKFYGILQKIGNPFSSGLPNPMGKAVNGIVTSFPTVEKSLTGTTDLGVDCGGDLLSYTGQSFQCDDKKEDLADQGSQTGKDQGNRQGEQIAQQIQRQQPRTDKNKTGSSYGDPHIVTFDGYRYSFQTVGEFTLVKSTDGSFEVQVRQSPVPGAQLSLNSAVAIKSSNSRIAIYGQSLPDSDTSTPIRVDGRPYPVQGGTLPNGTIIAQQGQGSYIIQTTSGEVVSVRKTSRNNLSYMDVNPSIPDIAGRYTGLLGNSNGNPKDDLQTRSGQVIETQSTYGQIAQTASSIIPGVGRIAGLVSKVENIVFDQLYKEFGNSWRISQADSLFDYKAGHTTDTFTDRGFPSSYRTLAMLSPAQVQTATAACQQANVNPEQLEGCIFDVGFTGDSGFAETASQALEIVNTINQLVPNAIPLPKLPVSIPGLPF